MSYGDKIYPAATTFVKFLLKNNKSFETAITFLEKVNEEEIFAFLKSI